MPQRDLELAQLPLKTGTAVTATLHIITAMIGSGVLQTPHSMAQLGWVAGPAALLLFYAIQLTFARLLAACFEVGGKQHPRYAEAVAHVLGRRAELACIWVQAVNISLASVAFTLTASISMQVAANIWCGLPPDASGREGGCCNSPWAMTLIFGASQLYFSQLPNIESSWILSSVGAGTGLLYSAVALALCIARVLQGHAHGTISGAPGTPAAKTFNILNALGTLGFAFSFSQILLEIQDTLREPPRAEVRMRTAVGAGLGLGVAFYMAVACAGYLAFGNSVAGDIYSEFDSPRYLLLACNVLVTLHMVASYNVFAQALFLNLEDFVGRWLGLADAVEAAAARAAAAAAKDASSPDLAYVRLHDEVLSCVTFTLPSGEARVGSIAGPYRVDAELKHWRQHPMAGRAVSVGVRAAYVAATTAVAVLCPFFNQVTGLVGSIAFWPLAVGFPLAMFEAVHKPTGRRRLLLRGAALFMLLVSIGATVGCLRNIINKWKSSDFA